MAYHADPGGVFASDTHRRTLGHLHDDPQSVGDLLDRMAPDTGTSFTDEAELADVLADLKADGYATQTDAGWKQSEAGLAALNAPLQED